MPHQSGEHDDRSERAEYFGRLQRLALATGVTLTFGLEPASRGLSLLDLIDDTVTRGGSMFGQAHSRGIESVMSFAARLPYDGLPAWAELRSRTLPAQAAAVQPTGELPGRLLRGPFERPSVSRP